RSSARTGGPAVRLPSVSYWPPWHGQPKPPAGSVGVKSTTPLFVFSSSFRLVNIGPFGCTGQPRCAQRFERTVKLGLPPTTPLLRTYAVRRETSPSGGLLRKVATTNSPSLKFEIGPRSISSWWCFW